MSQSDDGIKKLEKLTAALSEPHSEMDELIQNTNLLVAVLTDGGRFKRVSPSWTKLLGWTQEELCSKPWNDFMHPDDIQGSNEAYADRLTDHPRRFHVNRYRTIYGDYKTIHWFSPDSLVVTGNALAIAIVLPEGAIK